jgi:hypothetical protein
MEVCHIRGSCNYQTDRKEVLDHAAWHLKLDKNLKESVPEVPITYLCVVYVLVTGHFWFNKNVEVPGCPVWLETGSRKHYLKHVVQCYTLGK